MIPEYDTAFNRTIGVCPESLEQLIVRADATKLPVTDLVYKNSDMRYGIKDIYSIEVKGKQIGALSLRTRPDIQTTWISRIDIDYPSYYGKGFGTYAHLAAASIALYCGNTFRNDPNGLSDDAMRVWDRFIDSEVATVITEPWNNGTEYGWMGHFEIE